MLQLLQTLIKNLKDQTPKGDQLRRLTAEWLKQPKMKAYLKLQSSRKKDSHDASFTKQLGAMLSYELYLIQYACGFKPNVNHKKEPIKNVSFFPHRLPFISYGLFTMAAAASQVWPTKLMSTEEAIPSNTGFVPHSVLRSPDSWAMEAAFQVSPTEGPKAIFKPETFASKENWGMPEGAIKSSTRLIHPTWYSLTDHSNHSSSLFPARMSPMGWSEWSEQPMDPVTLYRYAAMTRDHWMKEWMLSDQHQVPVMLTLPRIPLEVDLWSQKAALSHWNTPSVDASDLYHTKITGFDPESGMSEVMNPIALPEKNPLDKSQNPSPVRLIHPILMADTAVSKKTFYPGGPNQKLVRDGSAGQQPFSGLSPKLSHFQFSFSIPTFSNGLQQSHPEMPKQLLDGMEKSNLGISQVVGLSAAAKKTANPVFYKGSNAPSSRYEELFEALFPYATTSRVLSPESHLGSPSQYVSRIRQRMRSFQKANKVEQMEFNPLKDQIDLSQSMIENLSQPVVQSAADRQNPQHRVTPGELLAHRHVLFLPKYMSLSWKQRLAKYGLSVKRQNKTLYKRFKKRFYKKNTMKWYRFNYRTYESAGKRLGRRHRRPNWLAAQYLRLYSSIPGTLMKGRRHSLLSTSGKPTMLGHLYTSPHTSGGLANGANSVRVGLTAQSRPAISDQTKLRLKEFGVWSNQLPTGSTEGFAKKVLKTWNRLYDSERRELADWYEQNQSHPIFQTLIPAAKNDMEIAPHGTDFSQTKSMDNLEGPSFSQTLPLSKRGPVDVSKAESNNTRFVPPAWSVSLFYATTPIPDTYPETYIRLVYNRIQERILEMAAFLPNTVTLSRNSDITNKKALERMNQKQPQDYMQIPLTKPTLETTSHNKLSRVLRRLVQKCLTDFRPHILVNDPQDYVMNRIGAAWNMKYRLDPYADPASKYPKTSEELETEETVTEVEDLEKQLFYKKLEQIFNLGPVKLPDLWRSRYWRSTSIDKTWRAHKLQDTRRTTHLTKYRAKDQANRRWQKRLETILQLRSIFSRTANRVLARTFPDQFQSQFETVFDRNWLRRETKVTRKLTRLLGSSVAQERLPRNRWSTSYPVVASYAHNLRVRPKMYENIYEKLWWSDLPNQYFYKDEKTKPKVSWFNSTVDRSTALTQMGLVLFHVCALFSLCTIPSVRDLLKFHVVLVYKLTDVYSPVMNVLSKIVHFATFGSTNYVPSDAHKVSGNSKDIRLPASFPEKLSIWLGQLFWDLKPTVEMRDLSRSVQGFVSPLKLKDKDRLVDPYEAPYLNLRLWANQSYRVLFLRSFSLAMTSFPQKLMAQPVELIKQVVWKVTNAYWKFMDTFFDKTSKYFADPWTGSSDMLAYVFFLPWAIDLVPAVPEQFESRMGLMYRRVSRSTVLWTSWELPWILLGPQIQRRMWSLAENWVQLFYQLDSDLSRRNQYNRYWWDGWVEILVMASQHYGIVLTSGGQQDEENQRTRLFDLVRQDPEWSWFNPERLPPGLRPDSAGLTHRVPSATNMASDFPIKLFGTQSQVIQPMNELEAWIEGPPAKSFTQVPNTPDTMATVGELIFQIMSGQWQSSPAQNFLVVGPEGPTKTEWLRALAGEVEIPLIQDSAYAYTTIVGDQPVGIQRLKQVFDAVTWHTPCLFLLEDIHMIGNRRTDALATDVTPKEFTNAMERPYVEFQHFDEMLFYSRHSLTHYRTPVRGDFANAVAAYDFCFNLFSSQSFVPTAEKKSESSLKSGASYWQALPLGAKRGDLTTSSRLDYWTLPGVKERFALTRLQGKDGHKGDVSRTLPPWQMWTLKLQDMSPIQPQDLVMELPMTGLTYFQQQKLEMDRTRYAMHAKITWLTQNRLVRKAGAVNIMNELLAILDQLRSQQGFAFFATTHVPEVLDPALRRPGRLDQTILLPSQIASKFAPLMSSSHEFVRYQSNFVPATVSPESLRDVAFVNRNKAQDASIELQKTGASFEHVYGETHRREMLKSLVYGNMAQRLTEITYQTSTMRFGATSHVEKGVQSPVSLNRLNSWWSQPNELARSIMPAIASYTGETLVLGSTGRQSGNLLCATENGGASKDIYNRMASWMEKRGVVAPRGWLTALFNLQNQTPLSEPPSPPTGAALVPIKRYEYYRRIERDFQNPVRMGWKDKWNLQQSLRSSFVAYRTNYKPFVRSEIDSKSMTSYTSALKQLIGSIDLLGGSAIQRYVDSRLWNRHVDYLTNLWSNAHWPESKMEDNQEYYLLQCLPDQNVPEQAKDFYFDFPEPEQYYVPRQRRWMLHHNSWQYPESFTKDWYDACYQHTVLEASARSLTWLDENREALDTLSWTYVQQGWVKDLHVQSIWQRFLSNRLFSTTIFLSPIVIPFGHFMWASYFGWQSFPVREGLPAIANEVVV